MGLYDTVRVQYPLPIPEAQGLTFQTKDLDCLMGEYIVTQGGRLVHTLTWDAWAREAYDDNTDTKHNGSLQIDGYIGETLYRFLLVFIDGSVVSIYTLLPKKETTLQVKEATGGG